MSLYHCIDLIEKELDILEKKEKYGYLRRFVANFLRPRVRSYGCLFFSEDKEFLIDLKEKLQTRISEDNYENLGLEIEIIKNYLRKNLHLRENKGLSWIFYDLDSIKARYQNRHNLNTDTSDEIYVKFQQRPYRIATLRQDTLFKMGISRGACYGYTNAMVDPTLSPYFKENTGEIIKLELTKKIYDYQKNQSDRQKDQEFIKNTRLTRLYFCPNSGKQAEKIWTFSKKNENKDLCLTRRTGNMNGHATYVSFQTDGVLRYADSNHGIYLFKNKNDFIDFYVAADRIQKKQHGIAFHFYSLSEKKYCPNNNTSNDSKTFAGKIRTLLTGSKYNNFLARQMDWLVGMCMGVLIGGVVGAVIGGLLGSVIPIFGTALGVAFGGMIGGYIGGVGMGGSMWFAGRRGYHGLLAIPFLLRETWYNFAKRISYPFSLQQRQQVTNLSSQPEPMTSFLQEEHSHFSYANILRQVASPNVNIGELSAQVGEPLMLQPKNNVPPIFEQRRSTLSLFSYLWNTNKKPPEQIQTLPSIQHVP